jgi:hypothetical protein
MGLIFEVNHIRANNRLQNEKTLLNNGLNVAFRDVEVYYLGVIEKYMTSMGVFRDQFKEWVNLT